MSYTIGKSTNSINNLIEKKIKSNKINNTNDIDDTNDMNDMDDMDDMDDVELEKLEKELVSKLYDKSTQPKNYGNIWSDDDREIILNYLKKNDYSKLTDGSKLYDDKVIQKIAKKTERSEYGVKEEIKKMIFNDYLGDYLGDYDILPKLSMKYNIPEHYVKILIRIYLEKYGKKILYPLEIENKILKFKVENIKLKAELKQLKTANF